MDTAILFSWHDRPNTAAPAGLHTSAPFLQPVLLIGSLYTRRLLHSRTSLSQSLGYSLVLPCTISDSYSLAEALFPDKSLLELTLTNKHLLLTIVFLFFICKQKTG